MRYSVRECETRIIWRASKLARRYQTEKAALKFVRFSRIVANEITVLRTERPDSAAETLRTFLVSDKAGPKEKKKLGPQIKLAVTVIVPAGRDSLCVGLTPCS